MINLAMEKSRKSPFVNHQIRWSGHSAAGRPTPLGEEEGFHASHVFFLANLMKMFDMDHEIAWEIYGIHWNIHAL